MLAQDLQLCWDMKSPRSLFLALSLCAAMIGLASTANALPITVFNTGVNSTGTVLAGGSLDTHYSIVGAGGPNALVISAALPGSWLANSSTSKWIWQNADGQPVNVDRTFRISFDMTGLDLSSAVLLGRWATDNTGLDILVNGVSTLQTNSGFSAWTNFSIGNSLLLSGINNVDFVVHDFGGIAGFRAEFTTATANAAAVPSVPEASSTLLLLGAALTGLAVWNRRKTSNR